MMMEALAASGATLLIVAGYALIKRLRRSHCHTNSGCMECDSPGIELQKKQTQRIDQIFEFLKITKPHEVRDPEFLEVPAPEKGEPKKEATISIAKVGDS